MTGRGVGTLRRMTEVVAAAGCGVTRNELLAVGLMVLGLVVALGAVAMALVVLCRQLVRRSPR